MSIREDVELYEKLSGEDGSRETIGTIGAYLRGYRQGKEDAEPLWIPCSEKLPEYGEDVLTITQDDVYEVNHVIDDVHGEWFWEDNGNVIAWMPLPEPYKGVTT